MDDGLWTVEAALGELRDLALSIAHRQVAIEGIATWLEKRCPRD